MAGFARRHGGLELTRSQFEEIAAGARPDFWPPLVDQGLHAVHLPEEFGGQGATLAEAAYVNGPAGYGLPPGPLLPTLIAGAVVAPPAPQPTPARPLPPQP